MEWGFEIFHTLAAFAVPGIALIVGFLAYRFGRHHERKDQNKKLKTMLKHTKPVIRQKGGKGK